MADLDTLAPNYRRAQQRWPTAATLEESYMALRTCFSNSEHGLVEHVQSFIDCICRTIMAEMDAPTLSSSTPSANELFVEALKSVGLHNTRRSSKLNKVLAGFNKLSTALGEMRNENGPVAHGKDGFLDPVSTDHARAFLHVGDAVLGVLLGALEGKQPDLRVTREPYEAFTYFHDQIDRAASMEVRVDEEDDGPVAVFSIASRPRGETVELRVVPSLLLYGTDRQAYVELLKTTELVVAESELDAGDEKEEKAVPKPDGVLRGKATAAAGPVMSLLPTYSGKLDTIREGLEAFLTAEGLDPAKAGIGPDQLVDSLLATAEQHMGLDWKIKESKQARLKVACKRVLFRFGSATQHADEVATRMVGWLRVQEPGIAPVSSESSVEGEGSSSLVN